MEDVDDIYIPTSVRAEHENNPNVSSSDSDDRNDRSPQKMGLKNVTLSQIRSQMMRLEKSHMEKVPVESAKEIARLHTTLVSSMMHVSL